MIRILTILATLCIPISMHAQIEASLVSTRDIAADVVIGADNSGNLYFIKDQTLFKDKAGSSINYNNLQLGDLFSANAFNPLKINVFYKDLNTVVILDNRLSEIFKLNFNTIRPFKNLTWVSSGNDNTIWLFNQNTQQLENFDYKAGKTRFTTLPIQGEVLALESNYNYCWLLTETDIYTYNYFGSLISRIPNDGFSGLKSYSGNLYLLKENTLYMRRGGTDEINRIPTGNLLIKQFFVTDETLYIYDGETLHLYHLNLN